MMVEDGVVVGLLGDKESDGPFGFSTAGPGC